MQHKLRPTMVGIIVVFLAVGISSAQNPSRKTGDMLIYQVVAQTQVSGGHLPAQAYAPQPQQHSSIKIAVTGVDPDGTAQVHVSIDRPYPADQIASKAPAYVVAAGRKGWEEQNRYKEFDARLSRDGALLFTVDLTPQSEEDTKGKSLAQMRDAAVAQVNDPKYQAMLAENEVSGTFAVPNVVSLSCAKRTSLAAGDAWHVVSKTNNAEYDIKITGTQSYHGHDTIVLSAKSHSEYPNSSNDSDSTVYYDSQAHLVVGADLVNTGTFKVNGMTSSTTTNLNLKD